MNFQCKNCGGNMVFSPEKQKMFCPYCDGTECQDVTGNGSLTVCASCGGELTIGQFVSASRCPFCNNYLIFDERVQDRFKPDEIIPFKLGKKQAVQAMEKEFKKRIFTPISFLSEKSLEDMIGRYVPFFLYDFNVNGHYQGEGTKVRHWSSGNYSYTETSYYDVERQMRVAYDNIPADASEAMPDATMDLIEPFNYKELKEFDPKYISGFFGEIYNATSDAYINRARSKAAQSAGSLMKASIAGYSSLIPRVDNIAVTDGKIDYALFPVWVYNYKWGERVFPFYVNGQTGKVIGKTPISKLKVLLYALTMGGIVASILVAAFSILEVWWWI
ncbi:MAG: hypothetical protein K6A74_07290 [Lachnospiraceae bacterium]|nr:hypothetical protein [Lachnospiraceae bacterium]